jgi:chromosome segregation ATPase
MVVERLTQTANEWRRTDAELQTVSKKNQTLTAELEGLTKAYESEHARRVTLERLAKDLAAQRENLIDTTNAQAEEEKQRRMDLNKSLQARLSEVNVQVGETERERMQLLQQNSVLKEKLKVIHEYLENKDKQYEQMLEQKSKEVVLFHDHMEERLGDAFQSIASQNSERELKSQLTQYQSKFEEFQNMIGSSTQAFDVYKENLQKLNERLAVAESEQVDLRRQCDVADVEMVRLVQAQQEAKRQREALRKEKAALETECRNRKQAKRQ